MDNQDFKLNEEQTQAVDKMYNFFKNNIKQLFQVDGPAGSGKSTITNIVVKKLLEEYDIKIVVCAPTNKAKKVLQKCFKKVGLLSRIQVLTIHQFMGSKIDYDDNGKVNFVFSHKCKWKGEYVNSYSIPLLIVDEISMVNEEIYGQFMSYLRLNPKMKIITFGDSLQLPPVDKTQKTKKSPFYNHPIDIRLYENMRNPNVKFNQCMAKLRKCIETEQEDPTLMDSIKKLECIKIIKEPKYYKPKVLNISSYKYIYKSEFDKKNQSIQFLNFISNKGNLNCVGNHNRAIREHLFNINPTDSSNIREGEQLEFKDTFLVFENSDIVRVIDASSSSVILDFTEFLRLNPMEHDISSGQSISLERSIVDELLEKNFFCKVVEIKNHSKKIDVVLLEVLDGLEIISVVSRDGNNLELFDEYIDILKQLIISFLVGYKKHTFYTEIRRYLWFSYYAYVKSINAPVTEFYAATIHKSQGSTYDVCILNYKSFDWIKDTVFRMKLLYVGLTRSKGITYLIL